MELTGLHILLTYSCNYECEHCFVWGSPWQTGTFTLGQLDEVYRQAREVDSINTIYFEGGEAFLYFPILREAIHRAKKLGYETGIVTNGYWATAIEDARSWLEPLATAGLDRLEISCDRYHGDENGESSTHPALVAARELFLEQSVIAVDPPIGLRDPAEAAPGMPLTGGGVMFRGRAAEVLIEGQPRQSWSLFTICPYEDLVDPGRLHLDPYGNLHLCQGVVIGNLFEQPLSQILTHFDPQSHPIAGPLNAGGPTRLVEKYRVPHEDGYVDACHLCYSTRKLLRSRFPAELRPDQMYGLIRE